MHAGAEMTIRPRPKGIFTFDPARPNHLMVATVTGIAPFISMVRSHLHRGVEGHRFYLLQGASYHDEFTYKDELEEYARKYADRVTYVPTVSRPHEERNRAWTGETGRVNDIVERYVERYELTPDDTLVYACGHPGMIESVKEQMVPRGFRVEEERFWKEG